MTEKHFSPDSDLSRAWDMLMVLAVTPPYEWLSKAEIHQAIQWMRVVGKPSPAPAQSSDDQIEAACSAYAKATDYYVEFHRGLSSESSDRMRKGMRAALSVVFTNAQAAQDQQLRDALREAERVRDEWCAEYVAIRDVQPQEVIPRKLTGEIACILEDCSPPDKQTPEAVAALIEGYQPVWDSIVAALTRPQRPEEDK